MATRSLGQAVLDLSTSLDGFKREVSTARTQSEGLQKQFNKASGALDQMGKVGARVTSILKMVGVAVSFHAVVKQIGDAVNAFGEQEMVLRRLERAVQNNPMMNGESARGLVDFAAAVQRSSTFGDELIIQQEAYLASLGMTENQVKDVIAASVDLASSGMFTLESAVKNVAKTFGGMTGELGEAIPALKELTKEQLAAGAAMDVIQAQFGGLGAAVAQSFEGQRQQIRNQIGDIKEQIGGIFAGLQAQAFPAMRSLFDGIGNWLTANGPKIFAFVSKFPEIAAAAFSAAVAIGRRAFQWDTFKEVMGTLGRGIFGMVQNAFKFAIEAARGFLKMLFAPIEMLGKFIWSALKNAFAKVVNFAIEGFNGLFDFLEKLLNGILTPVNKVLEFLGKDTIDLTNRPPTLGKLEEPPVQEWSALWNQMLADVGNGARDIAAAFGEYIAGQGKELAGVVSELGAIFGPEIAAFLDEYNRLIAEGVTQFDAFNLAVVNTAEGLEQAAAAAADAGGEIPRLGESLTEFASATEQVTGSLEQVLAELKGQREREAHAILTAGLPDVIVDRHRGDPFAGFAEATQQSQDEEARKAARERFVQGVGGMLSSVGNFVAQAGQRVLSFVTGQLMQSAPIEALMGGAMEMISAAIEQVAVPLALAFAQLLPVLEILINAAGPFLGQVFTMLGQVIANLMPFFETLATFIGALLQAIAPLIEIVLGIVQALAMALKPVIEAMTPVLTALGEIFEALWVVIGPVVTIIAKVATVFGWLVKKIVGIGLTIFYAITFQWGKIGEIDWGGTLADALAGVTTSIGSPATFAPQAATPFQFTPVTVPAGIEAGILDASPVGAGASFTQQRPINVEVNVIEPQVYGGTLREFAIILRNEFESLGVLGL